MFNFIDLQAKNRTDQPIQLKIWLTDKHLKGKLLSSVRRSTSYHVYEKNHAIIKESDRHFRYNELWRTTTTSTTKSLDELITVNFAPILYAMNTDYCRTRNFTYYDYTSAYTALKSPVPCATLAATSA
jgi:vancomycin resistance protein VanW